MRSKSVLRLLQIEYFGLNFLRCQRGRNGPLKDDTTEDLTLRGALPVFHLLYLIQHFCGGLEFVKFKRTQLLTHRSSSVLYTRTQTGMHSFKWHALSLQATNVTEGRLSHSCGDAQLIEVRLLACMRLRGLFPVVLLSGFC